jgi:hypothetical protein
MNPRDDALEAESAENDDFGIAVEAFRSALHAAFESPEIEHRVINLYEAYAGVFRDAAQAPAVATLAAQRYEPYAQATAEVFATEPPRASLEAAYRAYIAATKAAWSAVDPETLEPADLASIAEEMSWVAGVVGAIHHVTNWRP